MRTSQTLLSAILVASLGAAAQQPIPAAKPPAAEPGKGAPAAPATAQIPNATLRSQADAVLSTGQAVEAERLYRLAIRVAPSNAASHAGLARALALQGRPAESAYASAVRLTPKSVDYPREFAAYLVRQNRPESTEALRVLLAAWPADPAMHAAMGQALSNAQMWEDAQSEFAKADDLQPRQLPRLNLGFPAPWEASKAGELQRGTEPTYLSRFAGELFSAARLDQAISVCREILRRSPSSGTASRDAQRMLAQCLERQKRWVAAGDEFLKADQFVPTESSLFAGRLIKLTEYEHAAAFAGKILRQFSLSTVDVQLIAESLLAAGQDKQALRVYVAVTRSSTWFDIRGLSDSLIRQGRVQTAVDVCRQLAVDGRLPSYVTQQVADSLVLYAHHKEAAQILLVSGDKQAAGRLASQLLQRGKRSEAQDVYREILGARTIRLIDFSIQISDRDLAKAAYEGLFTFTADSLVDLIGGDCGPGTRQAGIFLQIQPGENIEIASPDLYQCNGLAHFVVNY